MSNYSGLVWKIRITLGAQFNKNISIMDNNLRKYKAHFVFYGTGNNK